MMNKVIVTTGRWFVFGYTVTHIPQRGYLRVSGGELVTDVKYDIYQVCIIQNPGTVNEHIYSIVETYSERRAVWYARRKLMLAIRDASSLFGFFTMVRYAMSYWLKRGGYYERHK